MRGNPLRVPATPWGGSQLELNPSPPLPQPLHTPSICPNMMVICLRGTMLYITIRRRLQRAWFHFFSLSLLYQIELNISCLVFNKIAAVCACENLVFASTESRQIWVRFPSSPSLGRCNRLHACNRGPGFLAKVCSSFLFSDYRVTRLCSYISLGSNAVISICIYLDSPLFAPLLAVPATCKTNSAPVAVLVFYKSIYGGVADV